MLRGQKCAFHIDRHHPIPLVLRGILDRGFNADARVVNQDIQAPVTISHRRHQCFDTRLLRHIGFNVVDVGIVGCAQVGAYDGIAVSEKASRYRRANILSGAGDNNDSSVVHAKGTGAA